MRLLIDTSDRERRVALARPDTLLGVRAFDIRNDIPSVLNQHIRSLLADAGQELASLSHIAVNTGPGGLSSTRCGIAFANALSFGLGVPALGIGRFDVLNAVAAERTKGPVLCIQSGLDGKGYVAISRNGVLTERFHGDVRSWAKRHADALQGAAVFGNTGLKDLVTNGRDALFKSLAADDILSAMNHLAAVRIDAGEAGMDGLVAVNESSFA